MGTPGRNDWPDGFALANSMSFRFPNFQVRKLLYSIDNVTFQNAAVRLLTFCINMIIDH